jgi:DNA modification methylase
MKYPCLLTKKISEISGAKYNPRKISDEAMGRLTKSLAEFGNIQPITWNARTGNVVGGHQRLKVYKAMGKTEVDVWAVDLDEQKEKAANIALNKLSGEFDMPMLKDILEEIDTGDLDMEITGFGMDEIALMMEDAHPEVTEDEVPEVPVDAITKPGDLWILGEHRVLCGDSTKQEDVSKLFDGCSSDICFTSPPYALGKSVALSGNKEMSKKKNAYDNHIDSTEEWESLMTKWFSASKQFVSCWLVNVQPLAGNKRSLIKFINQESVRLCDILTWDKGHSAPPMAAGVMGSRYEWIVIFGKEGQSRSIPFSSWRGTIQSVYEAPPQRNNEFSEIHAATMPIHLPLWIMKELCNSTKSVYDPFCGTGTTLIAAEQLGRKCYGMEISPNYCDVIVKRWENLTGKKATLAK